MEQVHFRVNTMQFLKEIFECNPMGGIFFAPVNVFRTLLAQVAQRSAEINDPVLNRLMFDLALYELPDPTTKEYGELMKAIYDAEKEHLSKSV